jgi:hypothetical protein
MLSPEYAQDYHDALTLIDTLNQVTSGAGWLVGWVGGWVGR